MSHLTRDGVKLCYEETGRGDPPLLLVHGWTCDRSYLGPQRDHFARSHRVVSVDLRGHGESDKPEQDYSMEGFADDLVWLCQELRLDRPVVIGHSMGGVIALAMAARHPELPRAIVSLDSPIVPPGELAATVQGILTQLDGPGFREVQKSFIAEALFIPSDDADRRKRIIEEMLAAPKHVMLSAFRHLGTYDTAAAAAACRVPYLCLAAAQALTDFPRLRELCPSAIAGQTVGAGHFHQLEVPEQVNSMIGRFLSVNALAGRG